jgi:hypothetical protein
MNFHGLDWGAMAFSLTALYLLGNRNRWGFLCFMTANLCWLGVGWTTGSLAIILGNAIFFATNFRGFRAWRKKTEIPIQVIPGEKV